MLKNCNNYKLLYINTTQTFLSTYKQTLNTHHTPALSMVFLCKLCKSFKTTLTFRNNSSSVEFLDLMISTLYIIIFFFRLYIKNYNNNVYYYYYYYHSCGDFCRLLLHGINARRMRIVHPKKD